MLTSRYAAATPPPADPPVIGSDSYNPSLLIIAAILIFVIAASASIHLLLRILSRPSSSATHPFASSSSSSSSSSGSSSPCDSDLTAVISPLPHAAAARISGDCAVCLSRLRPSDKLRLLPACRHAFHPTCIDTWLRSSPSCPLCRSAITTPRLEIRAAPELHPFWRSFSTGSSSEDLESSVERVPKEDLGGDRDASGDMAAAAEEEAGGDGGGRGGWLKEYMDRIALSTMESFSLIRRGSRRSDAGERESWDLEDGGGLSASFYGWLMGVNS